MKFQTLCVIVSSSAILGLMPPKVPVSGEQLGAVSVNGPRTSWQGRARDTGPKLTEFDVPGADTHNSPKCNPYCGTYPLAINRSGTIVGAYTDKHIVPHAFILGSGQLTSFDAPGAGLGQGLDQGTVALSINDNGEIVGQYQDAQYNFHGFIRHPDGTIKTVNAPGAGTGPNQGTYVNDINRYGMLAGHYLDSNGAGHGFVRSTSGFATFDPPNSTFTFVCGNSCFNDAGVTVGSFYDGRTDHGFIRFADGKITVIDGPQAVSTTLDGINDRGEISGFYYTHYKNYGFVLTKNVITSYEVLGDYTQSLAIDPQGAEAGSYRPHLNSPYFLYYRKPNGITMTFPIPGSGRGENQGLMYCAVNALATVTGYWEDSGGLNHGFILTH